MSKSERPRPPRWAAWMLAALIAAPASASTKASTRHYLKALLSQHEGNYAEALKEYEAASQLDPGAPYILEQAADLALEVGQPNKALEFSRRYVALAPKSAKAQILLGQVYLARGESFEAQKAFETALKFDSKSPEAMLDLGHLLSARSPRKAKLYFQRYLESNPDNAAEAHYQIAVVDQRQGLLDDAAAHLKAAIELHPDNPQGYYALAQIYEVKKDTDAALAQYQKLLEMEPEDLGLIDHTGELYFLKGDLGKAEAQFLTAKALAPHHPATCFWLAILAERQGDFASAARHLEDSAGLDQDPTLSLRLSYYLSQANRLEDSVKALERAHKKWPEKTDLAYFLALGYSDLKRYNDAVSLLQEVLKANPGSHDARFELAAMYEKLGRVADMEREFKTLLDRWPSDSVALNYLGYSLVERGVELPEAAALIRRAVDLDPGNGAYRDSLGWAYFKEKDYSEALGELQRAAALLPEDPTVWDHVGDAYAELKEPLKAWEAWKTSAASGPEDKKVLKKLAEAESAWTPKELGERLMEFLARRRGRIAGYAGFCQVSATVSNKTVALTGLLSFKSPKELSLDILGPFLVPLFRVQASEGKPFAMDSISAEGISQEALRRILEGSFVLLRDYLSGSLFSEHPAEYHNGWRTRFISTPRHQLFLDDAKGRVQGVKSGRDVPLRLSMDDFRAAQGHQVPAFFRIEGKGFSVSFQLQDPRISFQEPAAPAEP